jgi:hypothetical protein
MDNLKVLLTGFKETDKGHNKYRPHECDSQIKESAMMDKLAS